MLLRRGLKWNTRSTHKNPHTRPNVESHNSDAYLYIVVEAAASDARQSDRVDRLTSERLHRDDKRGTLLNPNV